MEATTESCKCPKCDGEKKIFTHMCGHGWRLVNCGQCGGTGLVPSEMIAWIAEGKRRRDDRMDRCVTLRSEAKRLGVSPTLLSRWEMGRCLWGTDTK